MCGNLIAYPKEQFSKLFLVRKILLHQTCEAYENSNTDIEELFSHVKDLKVVFFFGDECHQENYNVLEKVFEAVRDKSYFHLEAILFKKRKKRRKDARTKIGNFVYTAADMHTSWKKVKRMCL